MKKYRLVIDFRATIVFEDGNYFFERKRKIPKNTILSGKQIGEKIIVGVKEELEGHYFIPNNLVKEIALNE